MICQRLHLTLFAMIFAAGILLIPQTALAEEQSSPFPLWRSVAEGQEIPPPYGISIHFYQQEQDYDLVKLEVVGFDPGMIGNIDMENQLKEQDLQFDLWLFPFLNLFALVGRVDGETNVKLTAPLPDLTVDYDGLVYGAGFTAVGGYKKFFGSLTAVYTDTDLHEAESSINAWVITPKVGFTVRPDRVVRELSLWAGATYQQASEKHEGMITIPELGGLEIGYNVELEQKDAWNYNIGMEAGLTKHWRLYFEGGFSGRTHMEAALIYRFGH